ncbi:MAG: glycosyl transferase, group 1 [Polyangiaceae bacterium]|jgi:glycosyltransferase involved in cell wall biosynthesis|nr:glycosyl transferase, group 1 [Polyangiaceae bacterium]
MSDVLVDMTALNTGSRERGIGRYVRSLCSALANRAAWLPKYPGLPGAQLSVSGLVRHLGKTEGAEDATMGFGGDPSVKTSVWHYRRYKLERRLFLGGLLNRLECRLAHLPDPPGTPRGPCPPRIVTCHDLIPLVLADDYLSPVPGARLLQRESDKARYKGAARVIAISEATRRDLIEQLGVPPERIDVVHHGVDHQRFGPEAADGEREQLERALGISGPFLFYLGAGDTRKNLPLLIRAFARSGVAKDVSLVFAGPLTQRDRVRFNREAEQGGVGGRFQILGYTEEKHVAPLYRNCLAHVFPSSYEGFGLTVLEAMACGAPTLTTALSSLGEVAGDAALTLAALDVEHFADQLRRLVSSAELRGELRTRGLLHASKFTWERCAALTLGCYQRTLDELA